MGDNPSDQHGANPMTVNVHFHYPKNYKDRIENGAFGAKELSEDNLLELGEDGEYNDFEYIDDNHYDDYYSNDNVEDDTYNAYNEYFNEQQSDYDYYSDHFETDDNNNDQHIFEYEQDDNDDVDNNMRISIEKGKNEYVPYINPDVSGFGQK